MTQRKKETRTVTMTFSLTPHEEELLEQIRTRWFADRARTSSATVGRMIRETARRLGIEREEGHAPESDQGTQDASASER